MNYYALCRNVVADKGEAIFKGEKQRNRGEAEDTLNNTLNLTELKATNAIQSDLPPLRSDYPY